MGSSKFPIVPPPQGGTPGLPAPGQPGPMRPDEFTGTSSPNLITFGFDRVAPPATVYIQRDDQLFLSFMSQLANETVTVVVRILQPWVPTPLQPDTPRGAGANPAGLKVGPGYVQTIVVTVNSPTALVLGQKLIPLEEGYLLSVSLFATQAARIGDTFVRSALVRSISGGVNSNTASILAAGYVTTARPAGWPTGPYGDTTGGAGKIVGYNPANPAAGVDFSSISNIPGRVKLVFLSAKLVTSAAAGNRVVSFQLQGAGGGTGYVVQDTAAIPASSTVRYSLGPGCTNVRGAGAIATEQDITLPTPATYTSTGSLTVNSLTQGILGGDQWSQIQMVTEEFLENV